MIKELKPRGDLHSTNIIYILNNGTSKTIPRNNKLKTLKEQLGSDINLNLNSYS